jgi:hypothetical protein
LRRRTRVSILAEERGSAAPLRLPHRQKPAMEEE